MACLRLVSLRRHLLRQVRVRLVWVLWVVLQSSGWSRDGRLEDRRVLDDGAVSTLISIRISVRVWRQFWALTRRLAVGPIPVQDALPDAQAGRLFSMPDERVDLMRLDLFQILLGRSWGGQACRW
jgi:hypothetical protein